MMTPTTHAAIIQPSSLEDELLLASSVLLAVPDISAVVDSYLIMK